MDGIRIYFILKIEIKKLNVHILNGEDNYNLIFLSILTVLYNFDENWEFKIVKSLKGKPDIYCIKKIKLVQILLKIHILNGNNNFQSFLFQSRTVLHETNNNWNFKIGYYNRNRRPNIYCIYKKNTYSKYTEIYILNGDDNYQSSSKIITSLHETVINWAFLLRDYNNDGKLDLYCIIKNGENIKF